MVGVAEVGRVQGEHDLGGVLDSGDAFPRPAAVRRAALDERSRPATGPVRRRRRPAKSVRGPGRRRLVAARTRSGPGCRAPRPAPRRPRTGKRCRSPAHGRPLRACRGRRWRRRRRLSCRRCPARRAGRRRPRVEGVAGQRAATAGTTSVWPLTMRVGRWPLCAPGGHAGVGQPGYEGQPPRGGFDLCPRRLPRGQGVSQDARHRRLVARGVGGVDSDEGSGQFGQFSRIDVFPHRTEITCDSASETGDLRERVGRTGRAPMGLIRLVGPALRASPAAPAGGPGWSADPRRQRDPCAGMYVTRGLTRRARRQPLASRRTWPRLRGPSRPARGGRRGTGRPGR